MPKPTSDRTEFDHYMRAAHVALEREVRKRFKGCTVMILSVETGTDRGTGVTSHSTLPPEVTAALFADAARNMVTPDADIQTHTL